MSTTTIGDTASDAALVARHRAGDPEALADIYDRHAPAIHSFAARQLRSDHDAADATHDTFLLAHHRLDQLRDPRRLRSWLFAIARNEVVKRGRARGRVAPTDRTDDLVIDLRDETADVHRDELNTLLQSAAAGLDDRDRELLELSLHGLEGEELADAMGVGVDHSYVLVKRMRERVERSLGALLVARRGRKDCDELQDLLRDWDGRYTVKIRKRVARHIDDCDICTRTKLALVSPATLLAAVPVLLPPPPSIRLRLLDSVQAGPPPASFDAVDFSRPHGFPAPVRVARYSRRLLAWLGLGAVLALLVGWSAWQASADEPNDVQVLGATVQAGDDPASDDPAGDDEADSAGPTQGDEAVGSVGEGDDPSGGAGGGEGDSGATASDDSDDPPSAVAPAGGAGSGDEGDPAPGSTSTTSPDPTTSTTDREPTATTSPNPTTTTAGRGPTTSAAPPSTSPGRLVVETRRLDLGIATSGLVELSNPGGAPVAWKGHGDSPLVVPARGTVSPGATAAATVSVSGTGQLPEGPAKGVVGFEAGGSTSNVTVTYTIARPPTVTGLSASPETPDADSPTCANGGETVRVTARVLDESSLASVVVRWASSSGTGSTTMDGQGAAWAATLGPFPTGAVTWSVTATDQWGATATSTGAPIEARSCLRIDLPTPTLTVPTATFPIRTP